MPAQLSPPGTSLRVLVLTQGQWGERVVANLRRARPPAWTISNWAAPRALPLIIDEPADFLPVSFPAADLLLALGETAAAAQLIPAVAALSGTKSVIAPIDRNESLPPGLVGQLRGWLADLKVAVVFPKPFCSLTETTYNHPPIVTAYDDPFIREFARVFGWPRLALEVDAERRIQSAEVTRDSACGCAGHVAAGLIGCPVDEAEQRAGMLHHHFPCLAGMSQDADYKDTLMHVSGHILQEAVKAEIHEFVRVVHFRPAGRVDT